MFCTKCGTQLPDGAEVCPNCHVKVERESGFSDITKYAEKQAQKATDAVKTKFQETDNQFKAERKINDISDIFVDPDEQVKTVLGGSYLQNLIKNGSLEKGFGVLTNRRLYYRGKCFIKFGKGFSKVDKEETIDLQDITGTGFIFSRSIIMLILLCLSALGTGFLFIFMATGSRRQTMGVAPYFLVGLIACGVFGFFYWLSRRTMYEISFAGGSFAIKVPKGGTSEARSFDKKLRLTKDEFLEGKNIKNDL